MFVLSINVELKLFRRAVQAEEFNHENNMCQ